MNRPTPLLVGVPAETKVDEFRVALTPDGVRELGAHGVEVVVEAGAGAGSSLADDDYARAGAEVVKEAAEVWERADLVCKVKEPQPNEFEHFRPDLTVFTYLHLAAYPEAGDALVERGVTGIAYETVQLADGSLPLLAPMSEAAGRMAAQIGAHYLERHNGGRGVLLGGAPGVQPARVVVLGAGNVGLNAAWMAAGLEAEVNLLDKNVDRLRHVDQIQMGRITTLASNRGQVERVIDEADLVITGEGSFDDQSLRGGHRGGRVRPAGVALEVKVVVRHAALHVQAVEARLRVGRRELFDGGGVGRVGPARVAGGFAAGPGDRGQQDGVAGRDRLARALGGAGLDRHRPPAISQHDLLSGLGDGIIPGAEQRAHGNDAQCGRCIAARAARPGRGGPPRCGAPGGRGGAEKGRDPPGGLPRGGGAVLAGGGAGRVPPPRRRPPRVPPPQAPPLGPPAAPRGEPPPLAGSPGRHRSTTTGLRWPGRS